MKEWRLGWTSREYRSGRWTDVTEIREYEPDSDLSDLVCVVESERAQRIMAGQAALSRAQAPSGAVTAAAERLLNEPFHAEAYDWWFSSRDDVWLVARALLALAARPSGA